MDAMNAERQRREDVGLDFLDNPNLGGLHSKKMGGNWKNLIFLVW